MQREFSEVASLRRAFWAAGEFVAKNSLLSKCANRGSVVFIQQETREGCDSPRAKDPTKAGIRSFRAVTGKVTPVFRDNHEAAIPGSATLVVAFGKNAWTGAHAWCIDVWRVSCCAVLCQHWC
jgi:hypothetical protein